MQSDYDKTSLLPDGPLQNEIDFLLYYLDWL